MKIWISQGGKTVKLYEKGIEELRVYNLRVYNLELYTRVKSIQK